MRNCDSGAAGLVALDEHCDLYAP